MKNHILIGTAVANVTSQIADLLNQRLTLGQRYYGHNNPVRRCSEYFGPGAALLFANEVKNLKTCTTQPQIILGNAALAKALAKHLNKLCSQPSIQSLVKLTTSQNGLDCLEAYVKGLVEAGGLTHSIEAVLVHLYKAHLVKDSSCLFVSRWKRMIQNIQAMNQVKRSRYLVLLHALKSIQSDAESLFLTLNTVSVPTASGVKFIPITQGKAGASIAML